MKKITIIIGFLCVAFTANAQEETTTQKKFSFGIKAGTNNAWVLGAPSFDVSPNFGFHFGVMSELSLTKRFSLQAELLYSQQGGRRIQTISFNGGVFTQTTKYRFNYLNLPILAKYYVTKHWSVEAGPQIGILLDATEESNDLELDVRSRFEYIDLSAAIGTSYKLDNGLNFSARYQYSMRNNRDTSSNPPSFYNGVLQLSIGYFFK